MKKQTNEKQDLMDELKGKRMQLKFYNCKLNGGVFKVGNRETQMVAIDKEISIRKRTIEIVKIETELGSPQKYQIDDRWVQLVTEQKKEQMDDLQKTLKEKIDEKEKIETEVPELKKRINEIEKLLKMKKTDFKKEKLDYIG